MNFNYNCDGEILTVKVKSREEIEKSIKKLLAIQNKNMVSLSKSQEQVAKITTQYKKV